MSDESNTTMKNGETLGETLDRLVGTEQVEGAEPEGAKLDGVKLGLHVSNFPTAPEPSASEIVAPVDLEQSDPSRLTVGGHKRIREPIGLRSKRNGPKEPEPGHHIETA